MPFTKEFLTHGTGGQPIPVAGTAGTAATALHTAGTGTATKDEVWLYAANPGTAASVLTVQFGGTGANFQNTVTITNNAGAYEIIPGWPIANQGVVSAFSTSAVKPLIYGFVNRITP